MKFGMNKYGVYAPIEETDEQKADTTSQDEKTRPTRERRLTPYERTKAAVYATGNKWAIENFHATHD